LPAEIGAGVADIRLMTRSKNLALSRCCCAERQQYLDSTEQGSTALLLRSANIAIAAVLGDSIPGAGIQPMIRPAGANAARASIV
jgi:hypothetical protein